MQYIYAIFRGIASLLIVGVSAQGPISSSRKGPVPMTLLHIGQPKPVML